MGLDTSHGCWHGPYSRFGNWRNHIAERAGYVMAQEGDGMMAPEIDWDAITLKNIQGEWDALPKDPLVILFCHSDCDGVIHAEHCEPLAKRLEEILPRLDADSIYRAHTERFIAGLREAAKAGEDVDFH